MPYKEGAELAYCNKRCAASQDCPLGFDCVSPGICSVRVSAACQADDVWLVETNIDDLSPEIIAYACERLFAAGAVDVFTCPIGMKKGRQGVLVRVIVHDDRLDAVEATLFNETSTLGVRRYRAERSKLTRREATMSTRFGDVRVKIAEHAGQVVNVAPEYEDCRQAAEQAGVALRKVYEAALAAFDSEG